MGAFVCEKLSLVASREQKFRQILGGWYRIHRTSNSLWPDSLADWHVEQYPYGGTLTQVDLLRWMAKETGFDRLLDSDVLKSYQRLERWADGNDFSGSYNPLIYGATLTTGFLTYPLGKKRVTDPMVILMVLNGEIDPLM